MSHRSQQQDDVADTVAVALVIAGLAGLFFVLRLVVTMLVRSHTKYRTHPLIVGVTTSWLTALLVATTVALIVRAPAAGVAVGVTATAAWIGGVALAEIILDQRQPAVGDESLEQHLGGWWSQP